MIRVNRTAEPQYLARRRTKWLDELRQAKRLGDGEKFKKLQGRYAHENIKSALREMFLSRCAYCESAIEVVASSHIEHFRPKQRYISLTYSWDNLLLACPKCNDSEHKGTKFPNRIQGGPLIDPSFEDPAVHLEFLYDHITKLATIKPLTARGKTTVDILKLNSRPALVKARSDLVRQLLVLKQYDGLNIEATAILDEIRMNGSGYWAWLFKYI